MKAIVAMTAIAVTCLVKQEYNTENLAKCSGESKSGDIFDSIYRWALTYNASCLTIPLYTLSSWTTSLPILQKCFLSLIHGSESFRVTDHNIRKKKHTLV